MKKLFVSLSLAVLVSFYSFAHAADKVVVVPLGGTNVYVDPRNIVSAFHEFGGNASTVTLFTVPANKHFVLTDILGYANILISDSSSSRIQVRVGYFYDHASGSVLYPNPITISSGVVFDSETEVRATPTNVALGYYGFVTLSGYYY